SACPRLTSAGDVREANSHRTRMSILRRGLTPPPEINNEQNGDIPDFNVSMKSGMSPFCFLAECGLEGGGRAY
ncbi:MAG: hypothetical protein OEU40_05505, partial [Gammaproteobacteria bacterium]|nr:hypothetical protein [Gammaproteobacteria bacterium]